jgi:GxxExxY protein
MYNENELARIVTSSSLEVHRILGPGLLESVYEKCLLYELRSKGLEVEQQTRLPVNYKNELIDCGFRLDLWVEKKLIIELKAVEEINNIHLAQMITYLKLTGNKLGLLINFNVPLIKNGIRRVVRNLEEDGN